ncbi:MAG: hypothetical protein N3C12_15705 [Candidatus Binatia bacterium]|nr:hypothetical protein [Candidatus Binatia bacterium]
MLAETPAPKHHDEIFTQAAPNRELPWSALLGTVLVAAVVRLPDLSLPLEVRELDYVTVPWIGKSEFADPLRRALSFLADAIWYASLDEGALRLPWLLTGLVAVLLTTYIVSAMAGTLAGISAGLAVALAGNPTISGTALSPGPWVLTLSLMAVAIAVRGAFANVVCVLAIVCLLATVMTLGPAGWPAWLAVGALLVLRGREIGTWRWRVSVGVYAVATAVFWLIQSGAQRFFWPPWNGSTLRVLRGLWPEWVAPLAWALCVVGMWRTISRGAAWPIFVWFGTAVALNGLAQHRLWVLGEDLLAVTYFSALVLLAAGAAELGEWMARVYGARRLGIAAAVLLVVLPLLPLWPRQGMQTRRNWSEIARLVSDNVGLHDALATSLCQRAVAFYAPELFSRIPAESDVGRALAVFPAADGGWLVTPVEAHLHPDWRRVQDWIDRFGVIDLSPEPGVHVFYYRRAGRQVALRRAADFTLPVATLTRGRLLVDLLDVAGPVPTVLWKVDQLVLDQGALVERNEALVDAAEKLMAHGQLDRADSLLQRLLSFDPQWERAAQAHERLRSRLPPGW